MNNNKILQLKRIIELNNINRINLRFNYDLPDLQRLDIVDERSFRWTRLYIAIMRMELKKRAKETLLDELKQIQHGKSNSPKSK